MKKTISIHIKGFPFIIEEIAFSRLENYLNRLKSALKGQEGAEEIIEDIEMRIAELLNGKITSFKQVLEESDIIDVLNTLGDPSDYAEGDDNTKTEDETYSNTHTQDSREKRLYRDTENGYIGGVCAGLSSYFNIDPTIIRLIWAGAFFIGGVGLFLYIILWIIIPKANTSLDRLKMRGRPINVDTVKEEVERAANNVTEKSKQFANQIKNDERIKSGVSGFRKVVRTIFGLFLLGIGFIALISVIAFVFGTPQIIPATTDSGFLSLTSLSKLIFNEPMDTRLAWMSFYICAFSFIIFFLLGGFVTLFSLKNKWYRYINFFLIFAGIIGTSIGFVVASRTGRDFAIPVELEKEIATTNSLTILTKSGETIQRSDYKVKRRNMWYTFVQNNKISGYSVPVQYRVSKDSLFHVVLKKKANGHLATTAEKRAQNIEYLYEVKNDTVVLPSYYYYPASDKLRNQDVKIQIYIPKGKTISVEGKIINLDKPAEDFDEDEDFQFQSGRIENDGTYEHWNW
jgi:phage shock protein PspC (stress-responsive transcriptional regulator)